MPSGGGFLLLVSRFLEKSLSRLELAKKEHYSLNCVTGVKQGRVGKLWLQPRIRRKIVLVEEHLSSDGVREPEGRGDRQDIEIVGRVRDIGTRHHDRD